MDIDWQITEQESQQEMVSSDGRWHISKNKKGEQPPSFFLTNYDLLITPHGLGKDYKECFGSFIAECDTFIEKVKSIRDQARKHMDEMIAAERELGNHEN